MRNAAFVHDAPTYQVRAIRSNHLKRTFECAGREVGIIVWKHEPWCARVLRPQVAGGTGVAQFCSYMDKQRSLRRFKQVG